MERSDLIHVFDDTQRLCRENQSVSVSLKHSMHATRLYDADYYPSLRDDSGKETVAGDEETVCPVSVLPLTTFDAASKAHFSDPACQNDRIGILNFASAVSPGGGVKHGSRAQEESLCRQSTLYPCLDQKWLWDAYYQPNRNAGDRRNTDAVIYSPDVLVLKESAEPYQLLPEDKWVQVDVLTCAAPDLRVCEISAFCGQDGKSIHSMDDQAFCSLYEKRAEHILHIAAANHIDTLILGAFGCGAFGNDPNLAAECWSKAMVKYRKCFYRIIFAVYDPKHARKSNYDVFCQEFAAHS